jgi:hypothetical protein
MDTKYSVEDVHTDIVSAIETIAMIKIYSAMIVSRTIRVNANAIGWIVEGASGEIPVHGTLPRLRSGFLSRSDRIEKASSKAGLYVHRICGPWDYPALYSGRLFRGLLMQGISPALPYPMYYSILTYVP